MKAILLLLSACSIQSAHAWGFYGHQKINYQAVFLLPPRMLVFYKPHIGFLSEHAVDPDKRRYAIAEEGPRHYLDIDHYGSFPYDSLPRSWEKAKERFTEDSLNKHGIVPWWIGIMHRRLVKAFAEKNIPAVLRLSAEIGHYIGDAHVPLHASSNHNGQLTGQRGIHGFWESRIPELLAEQEWDFFIGKARYLDRPVDFIWDRFLESARAADTVLRMERELTGMFPSDRKYSFSERNGQLVRQYSAAFSQKYNQLLNGMIERRMRASVFAVASFWYTAWVEAGQPDLQAAAEFSAEEQQVFERLNQLWKSNSIIGRKEEDGDL